MGVSDAHLRFDDEVEFEIERYLGYIKLLKDVSPIIKFDVTVDDTNSTGFVPSVSCVTFSGFMNFCQGQWFLTGVQVRWLQAISSRSIRSSVR